MKRLVIAADVDPTFRDAAARDGRFVIVHKPVTSEDELAALAVDAEILVTRSYNRVTRGVIEWAPKLELIAQGTSGTDNIDLAAAKERGVTVISLPGENANAVAELVIGLMIALTRTLPAYNREMCRGVWNRDDCATRHELRHHSLGIVGLGEVGRRVAALARAFGMQPRAYDPYIGDDDFAQRGAVRVATLEDALDSDIVTLHVPLTEETRGMIEVGKVKRGAILINAARGEVLDARAALDALASHHLGGLALDVYDPEPPSLAWPDDLRLIVTPHIAGCTHEAKAAIGRKLYERIVAFYATQAPSRIT